MNVSSRGGGITIWAWGLSVGIHAMLLAFLAFVKFSQSSYGPSPAPAPAVTVSQIEQVVKQSRILPKPKIKRLLPNRRSGVYKKQTYLPVRTQINPAERRDSWEQAVGAGGIGLLAGSGIDAGKVEFFGQETSQRKICYVVDCSGSMQGLFGEVRSQLKSSIGNLEPDRYFYIIFFRGDELLESGHGRLVRATAETKSAAFKLIEKVQPGGKTNASAALERAMLIRDTEGQSAELIYFLTDGLDLEDADTSRFGPLVASFRKKLAPATKINTIGFWAQESDCAILRDVAMRNGGRFVNIK